MGSIGDPGLGSASPIVRQRGAVLRYAATREAAMAAFVKSWRYESRQRRVNRAEIITMAPSGTSYG
jgi:hypothetical protein